MTELDMIGDLPVSTPVKVVVSGRYLPGRFFADDGIGVLWAEGMDRQSLVQYVEHRCAAQPSLYFEENPAQAGYLGRDFVRIVAQLADFPSDWLLTPELELYLRVQRLAAKIVADGDVVAYAAAKTADFADVEADCLKLCVAEQDDFSHSASRADGYIAAWLPKWSEEQFRALRMLYVSLADEYWQGSWNHKTAWTRRDNGRILVGLWLAKCVNHFTRQVLASNLQPVVEDGRRSPYQIAYRGEEEALVAWHSALWASDDVGGCDKATFSADGWLVWRVLRQMFQMSGWREEWLCNRTGEAHYHLEFELLPPEPRSAATEWRLTYYVKHNQWDTRVPLSQWWTSTKRRLKVGREWLIGPDDWILPALYEAGKLCPPIAKSMRDPGPAGCAIGPDEVFDLVANRMPALRERGFTFRTPNLQGSPEQDVRIRVQVRKSRSKLAAATAALPQPSWFDLQQLVEFDWTVVMDGSEISKSEFEAMVEHQTPYVQLAGSWKLVPVQAILDQVRALGGSGKFPASASLLQFSRFILMNQEAANDQAKAPVAVDISYTESAFQAEDVLQALVSAKEPEPVPAPSGFQGVLRQYQAKGFAWLVHLRKIGCGGCLADDMGLGKTVQVLAYLLHVKETQEQRGLHLLICPTSLLQNWKAEIHRFTPSLRVYLHHGAARNAIFETGGRFQAVLSQYDVIVTTYATLVRDLEEISADLWDVVITDEAQNIKNADTKQAQAVRQVRATHRIALTGTPVENRLEELWSILQFTNPGYLGTLAWFRKRFASPISAHASATAARKLHQILGPILLRRRKTDPAIQMELPEKWEVGEYASLSAEQAALYQSIVNQLFTGIHQSRSEISRRGQILAALVRLKQVCDHPCLLVGGSGEKSRSGKLKLLLDLLDDVLAEGDAALVFTQFRDMGELLCEALQNQFGWRPRFLHGGLSAMVRGQIVDDFQSGRDPSPVLVLSLKAGGVGLNLTRANHVFHFDRWWNPAVEDQATDRAFRIGQTRDVQVHKFVCSGTLEERIDALINSKRTLSQAVVGESEGWLADMNDDALRELFALDAQAVEAED